MNLKTLKEIGSYCLAWFSGTFDLEVDFGFDGWRFSIHSVKFNR
jgi:recombination DNA repair RAD52 pathway protein